MAENSKIEWCHHTFNSWEGCEKVSAGCANCYAERRDKQYHSGEHWGSNGTRKMMSESYWRQPLKWNRDAVIAGERPRVFCSSLADVFERRKDLIKVRIRLFDMIQKTSNLDWLLLTKRPQEVLPILTEARDLSSECRFEDGHQKCVLTHRWLQDWLDGKPPENMWIGTTVENQEQADKRIPELLKIPAQMRFLSCEPLLGPVDLGYSLMLHDSPKWDGSCPMHFAGICPEGLRCNPPIHWVITGGESGPNARPMDVGWLNSIRDQCLTAGVPVFIKQMGSDYAQRKGYTDPKGGDWTEWAAEHRIRQFPNAKIT